MDITDLPDQKVFVVTGLDLGWDCVVGVFDKNIITEQQLRERFPEGEYIISKTSVSCNLDEY